MQTWTKPLTIVPFVLAATLVTGCFIDLDKKKDDGGGGTPPPQDTYVNDPSGSSGWSLDGATQCDEYGHYDHTFICYQKGNATYLTSCQEGGTCSDVAVSVSYLLDKDLGTSNVVNVEAFDNAQFVGNPVSVTSLTGFDASHAGATASSSLELPPGTYYLRAYIADPSDTMAPYQYGNMTLVTDAPVGLYGAASGPTSVVVQAPGSDQPQAPVVIMLDKLFASPDAGKTNAHLRVDLAMPQGTDATLGQKVYIELRTSADTTTAPAYSFTLMSDELLVDGRKGQAELVTPDLAEGAYYVRAFIDASGNGFADPGELQAVYTQGGQPAAVKVTTNSTQQVSLTLAKGS